MKLLDKAIQGLKPNKTEETEVHQAANTAIKKINSCLKNAKAVLGGSAVKGTWLSGTFDIDIFVQFDYKKFVNKSDKLPDTLKKVLKKKFKTTTIHGSRDYFQIKKGKFRFEVVPVLKIAKPKQAKNIMDMSPLHASWVKKNINKKLADEIRLMKAFCYAQNIYGAESYIRGFSGYACEVLIIHYCSFIKLIGAVSKWKEQQVIDTKNYFRKKNVFMELNKSKLQSPLILIDPVQKERNITAALSKESFDLFIKAAKQFIRKPSISYFQRKEFSIEKLKKKAGKNRLIIIKAIPKNAKEDITGTKLLKTFEFIKKELKKKDFKIRGSGWDWPGTRKKAYFWLVTDKELSNTKIIAGPPTKNKYHAKRFKKKYKKTFTKKKKLYAKIKRKYKKPEGLIKKMFKEKYIRERVKELKICH